MKRDKKKIHNMCKKNILFLDKIIVEKKLFNKIKNELEK